MVEEVLVLIVVEVVMMVYGGVVMTKMLVVTPRNLGKKNENFSHFLLVKFCG